MTNEQDTRISLRKHGAACEAGVVITIAGALYRPTELPANFTQRLQAI